MESDLPSVGHILQFGFPYGPTALQTARQLQLTLARNGARQRAYGNRDSLEELAAPEPERDPPRGFWPKWRRVWGANFAILSQREQWREDEALIIYDPAHAPAVRAHRNTIFVAAGPHWKSGSRRLTDRFRRFVNQQAWRRAACVVVCETRWLRVCGLDARAGEFRFSPARVGLWHIPPFVDPDLFNPKRAAPRFEGLKAVLFAGQMSSGAGFYLLADTFERFVARHPEATLLVAGEAGQPAEARQALGVFERPGLAGRTLFIGPVHEAAMPEIMASARLAAFPFLDDFDGKILALQCMASGAATISTSQGGLDDLPTIKTEPSIEGLLQSMELAWRDAERIGAGQAAQVRERYSLEPWERAWLDLLRWTRERRREGLPGRAGAMPR